MTPKNQVSQIQELLEKGVENVYPHKKFLEDKYREEVRELGSLINRNLEIWGI